MSASNPDKSLSEPAKSTLAPDDAKLASVEKKLRSVEICVGDILGSSGHTLYIPTDMKFALGGQIASRLLGLLAPESRKIVLRSVLKMCQDADWYPRIRPGHTKYFDIGREPIDFSYLALVAIPNQRDGMPSHDRLAQALLRIVKSPPAVDVNSNPPGTIVFAPLGTTDDKPFPVTQAAQLLCAAVEYGFSQKACFWDLVSVVRIVLSSEDVAKTYFSVFSEKSSAQVKFISKGGGSARDLSSAQSGKPSAAKTTEDVSDGCDCIICQDRVQSVALKCGHLLCFVCWITLAREKKTKGTILCPSCRADVSAKEPVIAFI